VGSDETTLRYASPDEPGVHRRRSGKGFVYKDAGGGRISDPAILARIKSHAIPPAWTEVWICADPSGHLQATGHDQRGRKQYRYHPAFRARQEEAKFRHTIAFAEALPALRGRVAADMAAPGLGRDKVLATIVNLLDTTMIRVGNPAYEKQNNSFALTTLLARHVSVEGPTLKFQFKGKSGRVWRLSVRNARVARVVRNCQDLPGQHLFQYLDEDGAQQSVSSSDVNAYLKAISGADVTSKDFRTWQGTVHVAVALAGLEPAKTKTEATHKVVEAVRRVAQILGNTPAVCRKCYVHPHVVESYLDRTLHLEIDDDDEGSGVGLSGEERAVLAFLKATEEEVGMPYAKTAPASAWSVSG
jgi:DNA topoisomerase-1